MDRHRRNGCSNGLLSSIRSPSTLEPFQNHLPSNSFQNPVTPIHGARLLDSPSEVAIASDVVFTMLGHPPDVRQIVLENLDSILPSLNPGIFIVHHTSSYFPAWLLMGMVSLGSGPLINETQLKQKVTT